MNILLYYKYYLIVNILPKTEIFTIIQNKNHKKNGHSKKIKVSSFHVHRNYYINTFD